MTERFKLESTPEISPEEKEKQKFWDDEIREWMAMQGDKVSAAKKSRDEIIKILYNNLNGWLPFTHKSSFAGAYRDPKGDLYYKNVPEEIPPGEIEDSEKKIRDIDAYLEEHHLMDEARAIAEQQAGTQDKALSKGEVHEFFADLYYAMRKKGYSKQDLSA